MGPSKCRMLATISNGLMLKQGDYDLLLKLIGYSMFCSQQLTTEVDSTCTSITSSRLLINHAMRNAHSEARGLHYVYTGVTAKGAR